MSEVGYRNKVLPNIFVNLCSLKMVMKLIFYSLFFFLQRGFSGHTVMEAQKISYGFSPGKNFWNAKLRRQLQFHNSACFTDVHTELDMQDMRTAICITSFVTSFV